MKNRKSLLLIISLLFVVAFVAAPVEAKRHGDKDQAQLQSETAGVQGNEGDVLKAVSENKDIEEYCLSDKADACKMQSKAIVDMFHDIRKDKKDYCESLSNKCFKGTENDDESKKLLKLRGDKKRQQEYRDTCYSFADQVKVQAIIDKQDKMQEMADALSKEAKAYKDGTLDQSDVELENQDQPDVEPVEAGCLENGDLVAWGIPSIPHIPSPKPKTTSSSSSSAPVEQKEVTDAGYKALRSVETESGKVTDTEKDQFISELNSRVGSN